MEPISFDDLGSAFKPSAGMGDPAVDAISTDIKLACLALQGFGEEEGASPSKLKALQLHPDTMLLCEAYGYAHWITSAVGKAKRFALTWKGMELAEKIRSLAHSAKKPTTGQKRVRGRLCP